MFMRQYHRSGNEEALTLSGRTRHFLQASHCTHSVSFCSTSSVSSSPCSSASFSLRRFFFFFPDSCGVTSFSFALSFAFCFTVSFSLASSAAFLPVRREADVPGISTETEVFEAASLVPTAVSSSLEPDFFAEKALAFDPIFCCLGVTGIEDISNELFLLVILSGCGPGKGDLGLGLFERSVFFIFFLALAVIIDSSAMGANSSFTNPSSEVPSFGEDLAFAGLSLISLLTAFSSRFFPITTLILFFEGSSRPEGASREGTTSDVIRFRLDVSSFVDSGVSVKTSSMLLVATFEVDGAGFGGFTFPPDFGDDNPLIVARLLLGIRIDSFFGFTGISGIGFTILFSSSLLLGSSFEVGNCGFSAANLIGSVVIVSIPTFDGNNAVRGNGLTSTVVISSRCCPKELSFAFEIVIPGDISPSSSDADGARSISKSSFLLISEVESEVLVFSFFDTRGKDDSEGGAMCASIDFLDSIFSFSDLSVSTVEFFES
mmetsp:Transcript_13789/g.32179  ORF Transcript_13789/g.32179 Transcript_13789/m.32179 type:complete len:489 (-) Transcript_13789:2082-3548(-)